MTMTSSFVLFYLFSGGSYILLPGASSVGHGEKTDRLHNFRFLIEAVTSSEPPFFKHFHAKQVRAGTEDQAAGSLVDNYGKPIPALFGKVRVIASSGTESTRRYMQMLSTVFRADDLRRALDMREAWTASIVKEIDDIISGADTSFTYHGKAKEAAENGLPKNPQSQLGNGKGQNEFTRRVVPIEGMAEYLSTEANADRKHIAKIVEHHSRAAVALNRLIEVLKGIVYKMKELLKGHNNGIDTGPDFELKRLTQVTGKLISDGSTSDVKELVSTAFSSPPNPSDMVTQVKKKIELLTHAVYDGSGGSGSSGTQDPFGVDASVKLGLYISDLIAYGSVGNTKAFDDFVKITGDTSPAEKMDRLSSTLNAIQIRRSAVRDAKKSLNDLLAQIRKEMMDNSGALGNKLKQMRSLLDGAERVGRDVYQAAEESGVEIDYDGSLDLYDEYSNRGEPKTQQLLNVAHRVHGHMLAFLRAVGDEDVKDDPLNMGIIEERERFHTDVSAIKGASELIEYSKQSKSSYRDVFTGIKALSPDVGKKIDRFNYYMANNGRDYENLKRSRSALLLDLEKMLVNARVASGCLLYGRYDVLMQNVKRNFPGLSDYTKFGPDSEDVGGSEAEAKWCGATHELGIKELRSSVIDHFTLLGLDSNADEDALMKAFAAKIQKYDVKKSKDTSISNPHYRILTEIYAAGHELSSSDTGIADYQRKLDSHINSVNKRIKAEKEARKSNRGGVP